MRPSLRWPVSGSGGVGNCNVALSVEAVAGLAHACRVHRLVRVRDETLRAADGARHVEPLVEAAEVLGCFERLLERGLGQAERRPESLELALVDHSR